MQNYKAFPKNFLLWGRSNPPPPPPLLIFVISLKLERLKSIEKANHTSFTTAPQMTSQLTIISSDNIFFYPTFLKKKILRSYSRHKAIHVNLYCITLSSKSNLILMFPTKKAVDSLNPRSVK